MKIVAIRKMITVSKIICNLSFFLIIISMEKIPAGLLGNFPMLV